MANPYKAPITSANELYQALKQSIAPPTKEERRARRPWISGDTWRLVDERTTLLKSPTYDWAKARRLGRAIRQAFKLDKKRRTEMAGLDIETALNENRVQEAWNLLKNWYRQASNQPQKPSFQKLRAVTEEYKVLYTKTQPPGNPIPIVVDRYTIPDTTPSEEEIETATKRLKWGKAPGPSGIRSDDVKRMLAAAKRSENPDRTQ